MKTELRMTVPVKSQHAMLAFHSKDQQLPSLVPFTRVGRSFFLSHSFLPLALAAPPIKCLPRVSRAVGVALVALPDTTNKYVVVSRYLGELLARRKPKFLYLVLPTPNRPILSMTIPKL